MEVVLGGTVLFNDLSGGWVTVRAGEPTTPSPTPTMVATRSVAAMVGTGPLLRRSHCNLAAGPGHPAWARSCPASCRRWHVRGRARGRHHGARLCGREGLVNELPYKRRGLRDRDRCRPLFVVPPAGQREPVRAVGEFYVLDPRLAPAPAGLDDVALGRFQMHLGEGVVVPGGQGAPLPAAVAFQQVQRSALLVPQEGVGGALSFVGVAAGAQRAFSELPGRPVIRRRDDQSREEGPENGCERRGC